MLDRPYAATEIQTPADAAECARLRKIVTRLASETLRSSYAAADVELAVGEAFSNAVKYGVRNSKVSVRVVAASKHKLSIEIAYPGSRFDTTVTTPQDPRNAAGGFGRVIMQHVTDSMKYCFKNGYTILRMTKRR